MAVTTGHPASAGCARCPGHDVARWCRDRNAPRRGGWCPRYRRRRGALTRRDAAAGNPARARARRSAPPRRCRRAARCRPACGRRGDRGAAGSARRTRAAPRDRSRLDRRAARLRVLKQRRAGRGGRPCRHREQHQERYGGGPRPRLRPCLLALAAAARVERCSGAEIVRQRRRSRPAVAADRAQHGGAALRPAERGDPVGAHVRPGLQPLQRGVSVLRPLGQHDAARGARGAGLAKAARRRAVDVQHVIAALGPGLRAIQGSICS